MFVIKILNSYLPCFFCFSGFSVFSDIFKVLYVNLFYKKTLKKAEKTENRKKTEIIGDIQNT